MYLELCQLNTLRGLLGNSTFPVGNRGVMDDVAKISSAPTCKCLAVIHVPWHNWTIFHFYHTFLLRATRGIPYPLAGGGQFHLSKEDWLLGRRLDLPGDDSSCHSSEQSLRNARNGRGHHEELKFCLTPLRIFWASKDVFSSHPSSSQSSDAGRYLPGIRWRPMIRRWLQGLFLRKAQI